MTVDRKSQIPEILKKYDAELLAEWTKAQVTHIGMVGRIKEAELREQCSTFLRLLQEASQGENFTKITTPEWTAAKEFLDEVSRSRGLQGFSPSETATFVFSLKRPLFSRLRRELEKDADFLTDETGRRHRATR